MMSSIRTSMVAAFDSESAGHNRDKTEELHSIQSFVAPIGKQTNFSMRLYQSQQQSLPSTSSHSKSSQQHVIMRRVLIGLVVGIFVVWLASRIIDPREYVFAGFVSWSATAAVAVDDTTTGIATTRPLKVIPIPNPVCCSDEFLCPMGGGGDRSLDPIPRNVAMARVEQMEWYDAPSRALSDGHDLARYMDHHYRDTEYDHWGHTYEELKASLYQWKSQHFVKGIKSGDRIYESACGIGLNAYMTLEIMDEVAGIQNIEFYGNDYARDSVTVAHCIAGSGRLPANGRLGAICRADSTDLSFGPSNFFHLVFTGYISPLFNPLDLPGLSTEENLATYRSYCQESATRTEGDSPSSAAQAREAQRIQEDWYAKWVEEMIRMAKPGAPILVEHVSPP
jgi:hypothetical protein